MGSPLPSGGYGSSARTGPRPLPQASFPPARLSQNMAGPGTKSLNRQGGATAPEASFFDRSRFFLAAAPLPIVWEAGRRAPRARPARKGQKNARKAPQPAAVPDRRSPDRPPPGKGSVQYFCPPVWLRQGLCKKNQTAFSLIANNKNNKNSKIEKHSSLDILARLMQ